MLEFSVAMTTSQHPSSAALPAKQRPELIPTSGTRPAEPAPIAERQQVEARRSDAVGIAGTPAATFGEEHHRQPLLLGDLEHAVLLAMVLLSLRAGEHGVVVGHQDAVGVRRVLEQIAVNAADAGDQSIRRGVLDQVLDGAAATLRRDHQRAVLDEGARIAKVVDILARGALMGLAPARDRVGPRFVETLRVALLHLVQIGADVVEVDLL